MTFYVDADGGYPWLVCGDCDEPLVEIDGGTRLHDLNAAANAHTCRENVTL